MSVETVRNPAQVVMRHFLHRGLLWRATGFVESLWRDKGRRLAMRCREDIGINPSESQHVFGLRVKSHPRNKGTLSLSFAGPAGMPFINPHTLQLAPGRVLLLAKDSGWKAGRSDLLSVTNRSDRAATYDVHILSGSADA